MKEALENFVGKDQLEGFTCSKTNQEVMAWQQMTLEKLPIVLVLHLKWFDYKMDGCTKILKTVEFPIELKIDSSEYHVFIYIYFITRKSHIEGLYSKVSVSHFCENQQDRLPTI